ncbi:TRAP transporter small permease subunit [Citrobacter amalonaticus]|nr:TRAP transporter small permease subunit [Citrobacter amalonaticus]
MADIPMKTKDENALLTLLGRLSRFLTTLTSWAGALVLFINVLVVFASVIWRYALHSPIHWAEEVARALMIALVFFWRRHLDRQRRTHWCRSVLTIFA